MSEGFGTQPGELDAAAGRFDEAAQVVAQAVAALRTRLAGLGEAIGSDDQGRAFAARYQPQAAEGLAALTREAAAVGSLGDALRSTAREYHDGDHGNAVPFGSPER